MMINRKMQCCQKVDGNHPPKTILLYGTFEFDNTKWYEHSNARLQYWIYLSVIFNSTIIWYYRVWYQYRSVSCLVGSISDNRVIIVLSIRYVCRVEIQDSSKSYSYFTYVHESGLVLVSELPQEFYFKTTVRYATVPVTLHSNFFQIKLLLLLTHTRTNNI